MSYAVMLCFSSQDQYFIDVKISGFSSEKCAESFGQSAGELILKGRILEFHQNDRIIPLEDRQVQLFAVKSEAIKRMESLSKTLDLSAPGDIDQVNKLIEPNALTLLPEDIESLNVSIEALHSIPCFPHHFELIGYEVLF